MLFHIFAVFAIHSPSALAFMPIACRLHSDGVAVYSTSMHFHFQRVSGLDQIKVQCSRLLNHRSFGSFSAQTFTMQDVESRISIPDGVNQIVISGLQKGSLYHCRCVSTNVGREWSFASPVLSTSTKTEVENPASFDSRFGRNFLRLTQSEGAHTVKLSWNPIAQDITALKVQISRQIPPIWSDTEFEIQDNFASLTHYDLGLEAFMDGEAYSVRLWFENLLGSNVSNVETFVVPFVYLRAVDVRAADTVEMSELTPDFHRKIYSYAVMVEQSCDEVQFGIAPMENVRSITADSMNDTAVSVDRMTATDDEEMLDAEKAARNVDLSAANDDLEKTQTQIDEEAAAETAGGDREANEGDERLGMDNELDPMTQTFPLNAPGNATRFTIASGLGVTYEVLVIRGEEVFGLPKYQRFAPAVPEPCPKQKRITIRYGSFWVWFKEYIIAFLLFVFMLFVAMFERSTRVDIGTLLLDEDGIQPEEAEEDAKGKETKESAPMLDAK